MVSDLVGSIALLVVCLGVSFCFSAVETAITSAGKAKLFALEQSHPEKAWVFRWVAENTQRALTVTLVGNNLANIASSSVATMVASLLYDGAKAILISIFLMTSFIVIFCEILPKNIAIVHSGKVLILFVPILRFLNTILAPVMAVTQSVVGVIGKVFGIDLDSYNSFVTREDVESIVRASGISGALEEGERKMIHSVITFEETRVSEVMVPRVDVKMLSLDTKVSDAIQMIQKTGHSRLPVYEKDVDSIVGMLYSKDLLKPLLAGKNNDPIENLLRAPIFVPETMRTVEVMELMRENQVHIAVVVDEYGGTGGLVTLEDLLEEIVGDIQDEFDDEKENIEEIGPGHYLVRAQINLEDLSDLVAYPFEVEEVDTLAGMVLYLCGNFPSEGQKVVYKDDWIITVVKVEHHRILEVELEHIEEDALDE